MAFDPEPQSSLVYDHKENGILQGSISAGVWVSNTGTPAGDWNCIPIYLASEQTGEESTRLEGYIESTAGQHCSLVLTYRSKTGSLSSTWGFRDDIIAYYYLDGRPHPVMTYNIKYPGAKNPLTLTGLWLDDQTRCPLRWEATKRRAGSNTPNLNEEYFLALPESDFFKPPLASVDDLASFRITIHKRQEVEDLESTGKHVAPVLPYNAKRLEHDPTEYYHPLLTEHMGLQIPSGSPNLASETLLNTNVPFPKSKPMVEFRVYYKNRAALERVGVVPISPGPQLPKLNGARPSIYDNGSSDISHEDSPQSTENSSRKRRRGAHQINEQPTLDGHSPHDNCSNEVRQINGHARTNPAEADAPPTAASQSAPSASIPSHRFPDLSSTRQSSISVQPSSDSQSRERIKWEPMENGTASYLPTRPHTSQAVDTSSQRAQSIGRTTESPAHSSKPVSETKTPRALTHLQSTMSRSTSNLVSSKEEQARDFLEELDIADEENVQALLSVGFKSKSRFLKTIPNLEESERKEIMDDLKESMGKVDFAILQKYLNKLLS